MIYLIIFIFILIGTDITFKILFTEPVKHKGFNFNITKFFIDLFIPYVKLPLKTKNNLQNKLKKAGLDYTPEEYQLKGFLHSFPFIILAVFSIIDKNIIIFISSIISVVFLNYRNISKISDNIDKMNSKIIEELPEFMSYMTNSLKTDRDIIKIVETYIDAASLPLKDELIQLLADLKSGNIDEAFYKFDMRINMPHLSNYIAVVRATLDGEMQISNLESVTSDMEHYEYELAKKRADELPSKVTKASFIVGGAFISYFLVVLIMVVIFELNKFI